MYVSSTFRHRGADSSRGAEDGGSSGLRSGDPCLCSLEETATVNLLKSDKLGAVAVARMPSDRTSSLLVCSLPSLSRIPSRSAVTVRTAETLD